MIKPYYDEDGITIYNCDCRDVLGQLKSVDLAFFDPPYNVGKDYGTASDRREDYTQWAAEICGMIRATASDFAVIVPNVNPGAWMLPLSGGWPVGMKIRAGNAIRKNWENKLCLLWTSLEPEKRQPNYWEDLRFKGEGYFFREETYGHPGYTPENLTRRVLGLRKIASVIDPFCGTGTTLVAARAFGLKAVGIEVNPAYCDIAIDRLRQQVLFTKEAA